MILTDAELLELDAEIDRVNEKLAAHKKNEKDCIDKAISRLVKPILSPSVINNQDIFDELRSISEARAVDVEHLKDLTKKLRNAIAEKEASSSK